MICDIAIAALTNIDCVETPDGARVITHCLHPTFEPVPVYIQTHLDGYLVHDGGEAFDLAWLENRSPKALQRAMSESALRFGVDTDGHRIFGRAISAEWLPNVVIAVANAAAASTAILLSGPTGLNEVDDTDLREQTHAVLIEAFADKNVHRRVDRRGRSGKKFKFAFSVTLGDRIALVDTVVPNPISVSSRYTAFSAVSARSLGGAYITHKAPIANEDSALLAEVADVVPLNILAAHIERGIGARSADVFQA